jgi:hypothetical protein
MAGIGPYAIEKRHEPPLGGSQFTDIPAATYSPRGFLPKYHRREEA